MCLNLTQVDIVTQRTIDVAENRVEQFPLEIYVSTGDSMFCPKNVQK